MLDAELESLSRLTERGSILAGLSGEQPRGVFCEGETYPFGHQAFLDWLQIEAILHHFREGCAG